MQDKNVINKNWRFRLIKQCVVIYKKLKSFIVLLLFILLSNCQGPVSCSDNEPTVSQIDPHGICLDQASYDGNLEKVQLLLNDAEAVSELNQYGETPLHTFSYASL